MIVFKQVFICFLCLILINLAPNTHHWLKNCCCVNTKHSMRQLKMPCRYFCSFDSDVIQSFLRGKCASLCPSVSDLVLSVLLLLKDRSSDSCIDFYEHSFCVCRSAPLPFLLLTHSLTHSLSSVCHYLIYFITLPLRTPLSLSLSLYLSVPLNQVFLSLFSHNMHISLSLPSNLNPMKHFFCIIYF